MLLPTLFIIAVLIGIYLLLDGFILFPREDPDARAAHKKEHDVIVVAGHGNLWLLAGAVSLQIFCGSWRTAPALALGIVTMPIPDVARLIALPVSRRSLYGARPERYAPPINSVGSQ